MDLLKKRLSIKGLIELSTCCLLLVTVLSLFDANSRYFELLSHFKNQYFYIAIALFTLLLLVKSYKVSIVAFMSLIINSVFTLPLYLSPNADERTTQGRTLKVMIANVYTANENHYKLINAVHTEAPDILVLQEVDTNWIKSLTAFEASFPHKIIRARDDNFGIALYSKFQPITETVTNWGNIDIPSIESQFNIDGDAFYVLATHPLPPISSVHYDYRNKQLNEVANRAKQIKSAKVLLGDLNITMWSSDYDKLERDTGLNNARNGFGTLPSWPTQIPPLMIPIEHILVSKEFHVRKIYTGTDIGSDHLPLIAELIFE